MSLKFIFGFAWLLPSIFLGWILYHHFYADNENVAETNGDMRIRMCREHIDTVKAEPENLPARQAVDECVMAGYITGAEAKTALD